MAKFDDFLKDELATELRPDEHVEGTAVVWEGPGVLLQLLLLGGLLASLMMKFRFAVITNQRLILIHTKMGLFGLKGGNLGVESFELAEMTHAEIKGTANQRRLIISPRDGVTRTLRLNTLARWISGQKGFPDVAKRAFTPKLPAK